MYSVQRIVSPSHPELLGKSIAESRDSPMLAWDMSHDGPGGKEAAAAAAAPACHIISGVNVARRIVEQYN
jgi:hypothetical protein